MSKTDVFELCERIEQNVRDVRELYTRYRSVSETLESFWSLQDGVARLVEAAHDNRPETFQMMRRVSPTLMEDLGDLLVYIEDMPAVYGVRLSRRAIDASLRVLEYLNEGSRAAEGNGYARIPADSSAIADKNDPEFRGRRMELKRQRRAQTASAL